MTHADVTHADITGPEAAAPSMWQRFTWRGHQVVVVQQWTDPFGRPMLRFADPENEDMAAGMPVADFLAEATPSPG